MTERKNGWTDSELQHVYNYVNVEGAVVALVQLLPNRTRAAIIAKLALIREEADIRVGGRRCFQRPGIEAEAMRHNSAALAAAIEDILARSAPSLSTGPRTESSGAGLARKADLC